MTPEELLEQINASYPTLSRYERLLLERPWLKPARVNPTLDEMRKQLRRLIDQNIPVIWTGRGFKIK